MTYTDLLNAWQVGARISYRHLRWERFLPPYNPDKEPQLKALFYRTNVKFKVHK